MTHADAGALRRRPLRDHRLPAPRQRRTSRRCVDWLDDARPARRVPRHRAARPRGRARRRLASPSSATTRSPPRSSAPGARRWCSSPSASPPTSSSSAARRAGSRAAWSRRPRRRSNEHFVARGFPVEVEHDDLGRTYRYPGAPFLMPASPWRISRRAPQVGEHDARDPRRLTMAESITVFRPACATTCPTDYGTLAAELEARARTFPGFVEFKDVRRRRRRAPGAGHLRVRRRRGRLARRRRAPRRAGARAATPSTRSTTSRSARSPPPRLAASGT